MKNCFNKGRTFKINVLPIIFLTLFCFFVQFVYGEELKVVPAYIVFDCKAGYDKDALTTADNEGNQIQGPEWDSFESSQTIYKPAYISKQEDNICLFQDFE